MRITDAILVGHLPLYFKLPSSDSGMVLVYPLAITSSTQGTVKFNLVVSYGDTICFGARLLTKPLSWDILMAGLMGQKCILMLFVKGFNFSSHAEAGSVRIMCDVWGKCLLRLKSQYTASPSRNDSCEQMNSSRENSLKACCSCSFL